MTPQQLLVSSTGRPAAPRPRDRTPSSEELGTASPPWGARSVSLRVGSLAVRLEGLDERLEALVRRHYAAFVAERGDGATESGTIAVGRAGGDHFLHLPRDEGTCEEARIGARANAGVLEAWSYFFAARWEAASPGGRLHLCEADELDTSQAVENCLRFYLATAALRQGGFVLHSAGVVRGGRAWLFFGPSGAGKSTTASHAGPGTTLLGDDLVLVEPAGEGFRACGVPFRGSFQGLAENSPRCAPLAMACRLFQDSAVAVETAPFTVRLAELLGEVPFLLDDARLRELAFSAVERFARTVPVRRLRLRADGSFWAALDAAAERPA